MPSTTVRLTPQSADNALTAVLTALPGELKIERDFSPEAEAEARSAAAHPVLPDRDATDVPLATIDPAGATDLDQAFHLSRDGSGYRFWYAIADLPSFVRPGGALDAEARRRGQTIYAPDRRIPLHPVEISEHTASLLPGQLRSAFLWEFSLDATGAVTSTALGRARVRSTRQLDYVSVQQAIDAGTADEPLELLKEFGELRLRLERARGGASLNSPETIIDKKDGRYVLVRRAVLPVESWNAQLSLLTGMEAAKLMLTGGVGILRTMPPAEDGAIDKFRRQTRALRHPWPETQAYGEYLASLDGTDGGDLAIMHAATRLFRGAGYTPFDGAAPEQTVQSAVGAPYAHVTAPLRRLVDRFGLEICAALSAGEAPPEWARAALPELPKEMARSSNLAGQLDNRALDAVEAAVLAPRVGETFDADVIAQTKDGCVVQLTDPAVTADCPGHPASGTQVRVRLDAAEVASSTVRFELV